MTDATNLFHKDLVALVADKNMEAVVSSLLSRSPDLKIRHFSFDIFVYPRRDPGCLNEAHDFLHPFRSVYRFALVMFDHEGCGRESVPAEMLADEVKLQLERSNWDGRAEVVILAPELEVWAWGDPSLLQEVIGWSEPMSLRDWLVERKLWLQDQSKPLRPKEALEAALRHVRKPRSSALYGELTRLVSLEGHTEPAFVRLTAALRRWFGSPAAQA
ncbi:MAG: hypothetical protein RMN53_14910 [Anaerolineae bacterium]|nr:hypothetical protein [Anaerolineae bacterium]